MRLSLRSQYAICGVFDLAYNSDGEPVQVRAIGERQQIPARYLEQIFQRLRRSALVTGKRGPGGGYVLARDAERITLRDVVEAVDGPLDERIARGPGGDSEATRYRPSFVWSELAADLAEQLDRVTVAELCRKAARRAVPRAEGRADMYMI